MDVPLFVKASSFYIDNPKIDAILKLHNNSTVCFSNEGEKRSM